MLTRGQLAQRSIAKSVAWDPRKDGYVWGFRVTDPSATSRTKAFTDVPVDCVVREMTTKEVEYWGKGKVSGGWKVTIPGNVQYLTHSFGTLGIPAEDWILVRGSVYDETKPRPVITGAEIMQIAAVHLQYQSGLVQEVWLFVGDSNGGPTRG